MSLCPYTKDQFLELWRQLLPKSYTGPIEREAGGQGLDVPALQAAIWAELERNLNLNQQAYFLKPHSIQTGPISEGGSKAFGTINIGRTAPAIGDLLLPAGTFLEATETDSYGAERLIARYLTLFPVTFAEGSSVPVPVAVAAEFIGYDGNIPEGKIHRFRVLGSPQVPGELLSSSSLVRRPVMGADTLTTELVGRYFRFSSGVAAEERAIPRRIVSVAQGAGEPSLTFEPPLTITSPPALVEIDVEEWGEVGLVIDQPLPIEGGHAASLDANGTDRGQGRAPGEDDDVYRERLCKLADIVSPAAIRRIVDRILTPCGVPFRILETRDIESLMGFTWDIHPFDNGSVAYMPKLPDSELVGQGIVFVGPSTSVRYFLILVGPSAEAPWGLSYDDAPTPAMCSYDQVPYDGGDRLLDCVAQLWTALNEARAAGVAFQIERVSQL